MEYININERGINYEVSLSDSICTSTQIRDVIGIGYLYTDAGSNPREFQGMTPTNTKIIKSILEDPKRFWAKHLGIALTIKSGTNDYDIKECKGILRYEDACVTNGLQSLSLFRILIMIKIFQKSKHKEEIHCKIIQKESFKKTIEEILLSVSEFFLSSITISQINKVLYWFSKPENVKYLDIINKLTVQQLLEIRISFKAVLLDAIIDNDEEDDLAIIPKWGDNIATTNNETQNVKADDKFGTKYKLWFDENIMDGINGKILNIEYRKYSMQKQDIPLKHILELLRAIIPTTLIIDDKSSDTFKMNVASIISKYANNRIPVYSVFEKLIKITITNDTPKEIADVIEILKKLMPQLVNIMFVFNTKLNNYYQKLKFEEVLKMSNQDEKSLKTRLGLKVDESDEELLNKAVKRQLRFSSTIIFPIFIFATRKSIKIDEKLQVNYEINEDDINEMIILIYDKLLKQRLTVQYGSTSDLFRDPELYTDAECKYELLSKTRKNVDYVEKYRINLSSY